MTQSATLQKLGQRVQVGEMVASPQNNPFLSTALFILVMVK